MPPAARTEQTWTLFFYQGATCRGRLNKPELFFFTTVPPAVAGWTNLNSFFLPRCRLPWQAEQTGILFSTKILPASRAELLKNYGAQNYAIFIHNAVFSCFWGFHFQNSTIFGNNSAIFGNNSAIFGNNSAIPGNNSTIVKNNSAIFGNNSAIFRNKSTILGNNSAILGNNSAIPGNNSTILGNNSTIFGNIRAIVKNICSIFPVLSCRVS